MARNSAVVVGGLGVIGRALIDHLTNHPDWGVVALSRRRPDFETSARFVSVDLSDRGDAHAKLAELDQTTHVFYAAYQAMPTYAEEVAPNVALLANAVDALVAAAPRLQHVNLMEGGKWYGCHLGPFRTPAVEDDPRHMPPNYYYDQEDFLQGRQRGKAWAWSALRPSLVCGPGVGHPMNLAMAIAVYASISGARRAPGPRCTRSPTRASSPRPRSGPPRPQRAPPRHSTSPTATSFAGATSGPSSPSHSTSRPPSRDTCP